MQPYDANRVQTMRPVELKIFDFPQLDRVKVGLNAKMILYLPHQLMDSPKCHPTSSWVKGDLIRQEELFGAKRRKEGASVCVNVLIMKCLALFSGSQGS